jgi:phage virion morphogenesis protein
MGGVTVTVNDAEVASALSEIVRQKRTAEPVLHRIADYLRQSEEKRFEAQVSPEGQPWQPLSPKYAAWKQRHGFIGGILTLHKHLRTEWSDRVQDNVLEFGTNKVYARIHQFGGPMHHEAHSSMMLRGLKGGKLISKKSASRKNRAGFTFQGTEIPATDATMPARPFFGLSQDDRSMILEICQRWMRGE